MKGLLKKTLINSLAIWLTSIATAGFIIQGGITTVLLSGFVLLLIQRLVKPILQVLTLPLNLITAGLFSFVINIVTLYILTLLVTSIRVVPFTFPGLAVGDFIIPKMHFGSGLAAFAAVSIVLTVIQNFIEWVER